VLHEPSVIQVSSKDPSTNSKPAAQSRVQVSPARNSVPPLVLQVPMAKLALLAKAGVVVHLFTTVTVPFMPSPQWGSHIQ